MKPRGPWTLIGALLPGLLFAIVLVVAWRVDARFGWVAEPWRAPWPIWGVAIGGLAGLIGNVSDYRYHRLGRAPLVGEPEHKSHLIALLTGGVPPWTWAGLQPLLRDIDALYINLISGWELDLATAHLIRTQFKGPIY